MTTSTVEPLRHVTVATDFSLGARAALSRTENPVVGRCGDPSRSGASGERLEQIAPRRTLARLEELLAGAHNEAPDPPTAERQ